MTDRTAFTGDITILARRIGLDPDLVEALVIVESGGDPDAWKPEPRYPYLWDVREGKPFRELTLEESIRNFPPKDFPALAGSSIQEWQGQRASWGLMQVMGAVAREYGFTGPYLTTLCSRPEVNLDKGTKVLARVLKRANGNVREALGIYNAGWGGRFSEPGLKYADKVLATMSALAPRP